MKVSVIIPVYNVEKYLRRCLDSVVNQTYKNLEIILVNDGSPDDSKEICEEYAAKHDNIQLISQENQGNSGARNTALKYITGEYVMFVDSDDWIELDAIEYCVESMKENNVDIVVTQMVRKKSYIPAKENTNILEKILTQEQYAKQFFKIGSNKIEYYIWSKLYKREVVNNITFPTGLSIGEDALMTFRYIINSRKIFYSTKVTYNYFYNDDSLTSKFSGKDFNLEKIWDLVIEDAVNYGNEEYIYYAKINRYRIDFNLLCRIALSENKEDTDKYKEKIKELLLKVKENKKILLEYLPLSRKIILRLFLVNYYVGSFSMRSANKILKKG